MGTPPDPLPDPPPGLPPGAPGAYLAALEAIAPAAARALRKRGHLSRGGAAEAVAALGALLPAALARHQAKRTALPHAAADLVAKYGSREALARPEPAVTAKLGASDLNPRLGGLLGDDGPRVAEWIAKRTGDTAESIGRGLAAVAPPVLGACSRVGDPEALRTWLTGHDAAPLAEPERLLDEAVFAGQVFRRLRARAFPWWSRVLP